MKKEGTKLDFICAGKASRGNEKCLIRVSDFKKKHKWLKQASCNFLAETLDHSILSLFTPALSERAASDMKVVHRQTRPRCQPAPTVDRGQGAADWGQAGWLASDLGRALLPQALTFCIFKLQRAKTGTLYRLRNPAQRPISLLNSMGTS